MWFVQKAFPIHNDLKHLAFRAENMSCNSALTSTRNSNVLTLNPLLNVLDPVGGPVLMYIGEQ